jgi:hypothetical protein
VAKIIEAHVWPKETQHKPDQDTNRNDINKLMIATKKGRIQNVQQLINFQWLNQLLAYSLVLKKNKNKNPANGPNSHNLAYKNPNSNKCKAKT